MKSSLQDVAKISARIERQQARDAEKLLEDGPSIDLCFEVSSALLPGFLLHWNPYKLDGFTGVIAHDPTIRKMGAGCSPRSIA